MSLFSTLNTGASGLGSSSASLSVIGDNIANISTTGYKASRANFSDMLPNGLSTGSGLAQIGTGSQVSGLSTFFGQGSLTSTTSALDMAISGEGFFQVSTASGDFYTRDGSFYMDSDGYVVTAGGLRLQGYNVNENGSVGKEIDDIQISTSPLPPNATSDVQFDLTLSAEATGGTVLSGASLDGATETIADLTDSVDYATSVTMYDSMGVEHEVTVLFERDPANPDTWTWAAVADGGETGNTDGYADLVSSGELTFDADGNLTTFTSTSAGLTFANGTDVFDPNFDFGLDATGAATDGSVTMYGDTSALNGISQDGYTNSALASVNVESDGTVTGQFENGEELVLGQVALATFDSNAGLDRLGGNLYGATLASGDAALGVAGTGGRGELASYALESSNVELEDEFVSMIQTQRAYQANARVISTADDTLQELVNLV